MSKRIRYRVLVQIEELDGDGEVTEGGYYEPFYVGVFPKLKDAEELQERVFELADNFLASGKKRSKV
jgi:hypothetical protein